MELKRTYSYNNFKGILIYKGQKYLVRINADVACRGLLRGKGTTTSVWRIHSDPDLNNENGVISGAKGFQGPYSLSKLKSKLKEWQWFE